MVKNNNKTKVNIDFKAEIELRSLYTRQAHKQQYKFLRRPLLKRACTIPSIQTPKNCMGVDQ